MLATTDYSLGRFLTRSWISSRDWSDLRAYYLLPEWLCRVPLSCRELNWYRLRIWSKLGADKHASKKITVPALTCYCFTLISSTKFFRCIEHSSLSMKLRAHLPSPPRRFPGRDASPNAGPFAASPGHCAPWPAPLPPARSALENSPVC